MSEHIEIDISRKLASGDVICMFSAPAEYEVLYNQVDHQQTYINVENTLDGFGLTIKKGGIEGSNYYYAAPKAYRLKHNADLNDIKKKFNEVGRRASAILGFVEFLNSAMGIDISYEAGFRFSIGDLQTALTSGDKPAAIDEFNQLINMSWIAKGLKSKQSKSLRERVEALIDFMTNEKYLVTDSNKINFQFTGLFALHIEIIELMLDEQVEDEEIKPAEEQVDLF